MRGFLLVVLTSLIVELSVAPPVTQNKKDGEHEEKENEVEDLEDMAGIMEYRRYLSEVVQALESDPDFRAELENANEADIRTGKIAEQLKFVNRNIRTKLDELKREELERLRHLATKENQLMNGLDTDHLKIAEHVDHTNAHTFEIQDLKKLIAKTTRDLAEADRRRREEFKMQEMHKKYEEQEKLKAMNNDDRQKYEQALKDLEEKHKQHEPVHHPGSKQQLEEVWEKQDHMEGEDFNPRTFFFLHDVDGNGVWDQDEVKALFLKELDKLYALGTAQNDPLKRMEEMERMREHMFKEADLNKDGLISYDEFLEQTKRPDFQQDEGWKGLDEQEIYTPDEFEIYEAIERHKQEEMQKRIAKGMPPSHPGNVPAQHDTFPPQYMNVPQGAIPPQGHEQYQVPQQQYHPQLSQHDQYQVPQQQYQVPQQQYQVPQQQYQVPQQQYPQGQVPQQQIHQGQVLQQPHQMMHPGQLPVEQAHPQGVQQQAHEKPHQQNSANDVPQSVPDHASSQQNTQIKTQGNSQSAQVPVEQGVHPNKIHSGEKV